MIIDGKKIAAEILLKLKRKVENLKNQNIIPGLAIILVGNDPASMTYVRQKEIKAKEIGAKAIVYNLKPTVSLEKLLELIQQLNKNQSAHGIVVQRPLPEQISEDEISKAVTLKKDIDSFHPESKFVTPLAQAVLKILEKVYASTPGVEPRKFKQWLKSKDITVIGKGQTGGGLIIKMLKKMGIEPSIIDSKTKKPKDLTKDADIVISTVGKLNIIRHNMIKKGIILISVGLHKENDGKLHGDYEEEEIKDIASFYTPTPGGVGPVNVAMLLENLVTAAKKT